MVLISKVAGEDGGATYICGQVHSDYRIQLCTQWPVLAVVFHSLEAISSQCFILVFCLIYLMLHSVNDFHPSFRLKYHWCKKLCLQEDRFSGHVCVCCWWVLKVIVMFQCNYCYR